MHTSRLVFALSMTGSLTLLACADEGEPGACGGEDCSRECRELSAEGPCDVSDDDCQERLFAAVGCVLDQHAVQPPVRIITDEEHMEEVAAMNRPPQPIDAGLPADASPLGEVMPIVSLQDINNQALGLFNLWQERSAPPSGARQLGYYSGARLGVTLIEYGEAPDSDTPVRTLAHEFVHAYQEQQYRLAVPIFSTRDTAEVVGILAEGEARLYDVITLAMLKQSRIDPNQMRDSFTHDLDRARQIVATAGSPHNDIAFLQYGLGASYLLRAWLDGGNPAVQAVHDAIPNTSVQWMRGLASKRDPLWHTSDRRLSCITAGRPDGARAFNQDSLGALYLFAFLSVNQASDGEPPIERSWQRALEWQYDSFEISRGPNNEIAASWRILLTSAELARTLESELASDLPAIAVYRQDAELELRASDSDELLASWTSLDCAE